VQIDIITYGNYDCL